MITWLILFLILAAVFCAARYSIRKVRKGECVGCSGCKEHCRCHSQK